VAGKPIISRMRIDLSGVLLWWRHYSATGSGLSQAQAALILGVSLSTYRSWEQGRHCPDLHSPRGCRGVPLWMEMVNRAPELADGVRRALLRDLREAED